MFTIVIQEKGGEQRRMVFNKTEITIGRVQGNDIVLPKGNVSKRHARIVLKDGKFIIVDLKSTNGTYVNGRKISSPLVVKDTDKIYIGDFIVGVDEGGSSDELAAEPEEIAAEEEENSVPPGPPPGPTPGSVARNLPTPDAGRPRPTEAVQVVVPPPADAPSVPAPRPIPRPGGFTGVPPIGGPGNSAPAGAAGSSAAMGIPPMGARPRPAPTGAPPVGLGAIPPIAAPERAAPERAAPAAALDAAPSPIAPAPSAPTPVPGGLSPVAPQPASTSVGASNAAAGPNRAPLGTPVAANAAARRLPSVAAKPVAARSMAPAQVRGVVVPPLDVKAVKMLDLQTVILERVRAKLDLDKQPPERLADEEMWQRAERAIVDMVNSLSSSGELPSYIDHDLLIKETINEALGLGVLEDLLADESIDEIIVDRRDRVVIGRDGQLAPAGKAFSSDDVVTRVIARLAAPAGVQLAQHPLVDVRLRDGSRLTAAVPPIATRGPCFVLKKPMARAVTLSALTSANAMSANMADYLSEAMKARRNILVCGGPASGKTGVVAALAHAAAPGERIISVEAVSELALSREEWVALEARPSDGRNHGIGMVELVNKAMRMYPDRLVIGDVTGAEAFDLASKLGTAVDGAIVSVGGEGGQAALLRMALLCRAAGEVAEAVGRELVAAAK